MSRRSAARAIVVGGLVGGAFDIMYACSFAAANGGDWVRVGNAVASGLLGRAAFAHGTGVAALGFALHFAIALGWAAIYVAASRKLAFLTEHPLIAGPLYGLVVYLAMNFIVLPLSAAPAFRHTTLGVILDLGSHTLLLAPSIALAARHAALADGTSRTRVMNA